MLTEVSLRRVRMVRVRMYPNQENPHLRSEGRGGSYGEGCKVRGGGRGFWEEVEAEIGEQEGSKEAGE